VEQDLDLDPSVRVSGGRFWLASGSRWHQGGDAAGPPLRRRSPRQGVSKGRLSLPAGPGDAGLLLGQESAQS